MADSQPNSNAPPAGGAPGGAPPQDMLDKAVQWGANKAGHATDASTTEKISDGIRSVFHKATGKDIPIKDKQ